MNKIKQQFVSDEIKSLLYKKGFRFEEKEEGHRVLHSLAKQKFNQGDLSYIDIEVWFIVEWLRVEHNLWLEIRLGKFCERVWYDWFVLSSIPDDTYHNIAWSKEVIKTKTPQEAYSEAIKYTLLNLIK